MNTKKINYILDTNTIIRYLTNDQEEQTQYFEKFLQKVGLGSLFIPDLVIAEIVYVLLSVYKLTKEEIIEDLNLIIDFEKFKTNKKLLKQTLSIYQRNNISFVDAYICALTKTKENTVLITFDKKLQKFQGIPTKSLTKA